MPSFWRTAISRRRTRTARSADFTAKNDGSYAWSVFPAGSDVALKVKDDRPLFVENPHYLRIVARTPGSGVANKAYDGIFLKKGDALHLALYMRSYDYRGTVHGGRARRGDGRVLRALQGASRRTVA